MSKKSLESTQEYSASVADSEASTLAESMSKQSFFEKLKGKSTKLPEGRSPQKKEKSKIDYEAKSAYLSMR